MISAESAYGFFEQQNGFTVHDIQYDFVIDEKLVNKKGGINAPVEKGQVIGTLTITGDGKVLDTVQLLSAETLERNTLKWLFFTVIESIIFKLLAALVAVVLIIRTINKIRYRNRYGRLRF